MVAATDMPYVPLRDNFGGAAPDTHGTSTWKALLQRRVPPLSWLPAYEMKYFLTDVTAGITLGTMCLAQTLAHATIATTEPIQGPYCALLPPLLYALLGTSRHGSVSSGAMAAMILANVLQPFPDIKDRTELASLLALLAGFFQILMGVFDLASAVRFLSQPTLSGFVTGGAVLIIVSQLKSFFGFEVFPHEATPFGKVWACAMRLEEANWANVGLCSGLILFLIGAKRLKAMAKTSGQSSRVWRVLAQLSQIKQILVVVFGVVFVRLTAESGARIVPVVGHIPQGLPPFRAPWELAAARKLAAGPPEVLQGFVASGLVVAFSAFLTSFSSFKKRGGGGKGGGRGRGEGGKGGERGGEKIVKGEFKELFFLLFFPTATQQTENKIQNNKQTK
ncbi:unnamed protein product [Effrenium voratum]|nr:unnamed protein product [Effrenium voratum]